MVGGNSQDTTILFTIQHLLQPPGIYLNTITVHLAITGHALTKVHRFSRTLTTGLDSTHTMANVAGATTTIAHITAITSGFVIHLPPMLTSMLVTMKSIRWNTPLPKTTLLVLFA